LREIVQQRAKVPAKIHSMEAGPRRADAAPASPPGIIGGPLIVQYAAAQAGGDAAPGAAPSNDKRPPRPPGTPAAPVTSSPGGSSAGRAPPRKPSEGRKPRSGSDPGRRAPSEPARARNHGVDSASENASDGRPPQARAKARSSSVRARIGDAAPPVDRKDVGKVPVYLRRRQEEMAEEKRRAARPHSPQAPPGYRKVPESEKQATMQVLTQRKKEVETAQRNLPFKIETAGQKQREKDLTDRLAHLDKLIGMFSQPVVFIPADAEPIASSVPPLPQGLAGRPTRERDEGTSLIEDGQANRACREPRQRSCSVGGGEEVSGGYTPQVNRPSSRESRARADRRMQAEPAPWDRGVPACNNIRTGVQVAAPPGGRSSLSLNWN